METFYSQFSNVYKVLNTKTHFQILLSSLRICCLYGFKETFLESIARNSLEFFEILWIISLLIIILGTNIIVLICWALTRYAISKFFLFFFFWPYCAACGILVPPSGIKLFSPVLEAQSLTTGLNREVPILNL